jgi:hypothetical protein
MFARLRSSRSANLFVEIFMIVAGISIALWFEGLYEELQERDTEKQYLQGLVDDLHTDIEMLDNIISSNESRMEQLQAIIPKLDGLAEAPPEAQARAIFTPSTYWFFEPANVTYLSMRESGDFRLLSDSHIKESLLSLMRQYDLIGMLQTNFLQALDDGYIPQMMVSFDLIETRITHPELLQDQGFRNFFVFTLQDTGNRVTALKNARTEASELLAAIAAQLEG